MCINVFLLMHVYGLNTELIDGSSKFEVKTFKTIRQFFVRLFVIVFNVHVCISKNNNYSITKNVFSARIFLQFE